MTSLSSRLPLWFPVGIGAGVALYFALPGMTPLWPYALGALGVLLLLAVSWRLVITRLLLMAAFAILLGLAASALRVQMVAAPVLNEPIFFQNVEGTVEDIQRKEKKVQIVLSNPSVETLAPEDTPEHLSITVRKLDVPLSIGARIRMPATLFSPPAPAMPGAYDFARMFYFAKMGAVGFSPRQPEILTPGIDHDIWSRLTRLRLDIANHMVSVMGVEDGSIASAMLVGEQSLVSQEVSDSMRASGIYHILSISGLHMSLATGLIFVVIRLILAMIPYTAIHWPNKKIAAVCGLIGGAAYLLLAGAPVPAVRSYIMVACVLAAMLMDRKGISMFSLAWAAALILLLMPESLFTASFQLSFAATLAIVALFERYGAVLFHGNASVPMRIALYFFGLMVTSLAASLYTTPLAVMHFNRMAIYGIFANMLIVPLSSFWIMPWALLAMLALPLHLDIFPLHMLKWGLDVMMVISRFVSAFPYANITLPSPSNWGFVLIIIGGLWLALWNTRWRLIGIPLLVLGLGTIALFKPYDLIISDDAKRIAYRSESGQWVMLRGDVDGFEPALWARAQGVEELMARKDALDSIPELSCDKKTCMITHGKTTIVAAIGNGAGDLCESGAEIIITAQYLHCDHTSYVIDREFVERHGASAVRFAQGVQIDTTEERRGRWPWVKQVLVERQDGAMMPSDQPHSQ